MTVPYLVAGNRSWSRRAFDEVISAYPGRWTFLADREELSLESATATHPRFIFFLHWSWIVPVELVQAYECVGFHMTDLPYGRGGSPLQNLILRGKEETKLTAFRLTKGLDAGPVYGKQPLSLEGSAEEIYLRASFLAAEMIRTIIEEEPTPTPQEGDVVVFKRRQPEESEIDPGASVTELYDFIRMLDAEGYPRAFFRRNGVRYEFSGAALSEGGLEARVSITFEEEGE